MLASIEGNEKAYREEIVNYLTWQKKWFIFSWWKSTCCFSALLLFFSLIFILFLLFFHFCLFFFFPLPLLLFWNETRGMEGMPILLLLASSIYLVSGFKCPWQLFSLQGLYKLLPLNREVRRLLNYHLLAVCYKDRFLFPNRQVQIIFAYRT